MAMIAGFGLATAGSTQSPTADSRVMHLWVDPHHGNDLAALQYGPTPFNTTQRCDIVNGENGPPDVANQSGAVLLHQSYPFKTISTAVAYLRGLPPSGRVIATQPLPWVGRTGKRWEYAVIHLLPGLYRRVQTASPSVPETEPHNQLRSNSEQFPIDLPNHVSIQGTSALDTVIDLAGDGPAFRFGALEDSEGVHSFITQVSIFGAPADLTEKLDPVPEDASAIYCARDRACSPAITDCFLFGNGVGILVDGERDRVTNQGIVSHEVIVANCTLAWNLIGIWNGDSTDFPDQLVSKGCPT
jgi:hypothetical protein